MKTGCKYTSHNRSHCTEFRLMQKYVKSYMCIFISLNHSNVTLVIQIHAFYFTPIFICDFWEARHIHWPNLGRGSNSSRNTCLEEYIRNYNIANETQEHINMTTCRHNEKEEGKEEKGRMREIS